jgi:hypothetical protein
MSRSDRVLNSNDSAICAFDDLVPAGSSVAVVAPDRCNSQPHGVEKEVQRKIAGQPGVQILSLTVRRLDEGVCLDGTLEVDRPCPDLTTLLKQIAGVKNVVNRMRVRQVDRLSTPVSLDDDTAFM